ncbi:VAMP-associated protein [Auricularia subglabra TFB-10046 SS5]|nr:VAMP-associated protein [Auricularia subglabra TFB-10046 SS5]
MSVSLNPAQQLSFQRPLTSLVKRTLSISNPNPQPVAFKVKTTAPKLYCVRPNSGRIEPNEMVDVLVMLLPMKEDPPASTKCKDKFLVQSITINPDKDQLALPEIWATPEGGQAPHVHQQKIKVAWLQAEGLPATEEADESEYPSVLTNQDDSTRYDTVRQAPSLNGFSQVLPSEPQLVGPGAATPPMRTVSPAAHYHDSTEDHVDAVPPTIAVHTPPRTPPPVPHQQQPDHSAQLAEAQAEVQRLRALLASIPEPATELRRRKGLAADDDAKSDKTEDGPAFDQALVEGYSPQQVAIIAFAVFLFTYLFF